MSRHFRARLSLSFKGDGDLRRFGDNHLRAKSSSLIKGDGDLRLRAGLLSSPIKRDGGRDNHPRARSLSSSFKGDCDRRRFGDNRLRAKSSSLIKGDGDRRPRARLLSSPINRDGGRDNHPRARSLSSSFKGDCDRRRFGDNRLRAGLLSSPIKRDGDLRPRAALLSSPVKRRRLSSVAGRCVVSA